MPAFAQRIRQVAFDLADETQSAKNERAVELHQRSAGPDLGKCGFPRIDAADANQRECVLDAQISLRQHPGRERKQRGAGEPARLLRGCPVAQGGRARHSRVADDHAVEAMPARRGDDRVELAEREVGRDLDQHRRRGRLTARALTRVHHPRQQLVECTPLLQVAQARCIR